MKAHVFNGQLFVGDGVISEHDERHGIIRSTDPTYDYQNKPSKIKVLVVDWWVKRRGKWKVEQENVEAYTVRRETFWEYLGRPSGFGRMKWVQAYLIALMLVIGWTVVAFTWNSGGAWVALGLLIIPAVILFASWMQYTRRWV